MRIINSLTRSFIGRSLLCISLGLMMSPLFAEDKILVENALITSISSGNKDTIQITIANGKYDNLQECENQVAYAFTLKGSKGFENHRTLLMAAYVGAKEVDITIDGCVQGMPRIVKVSI